MTRIMHITRWAAVASALMATLTTGCAVGTDSDPEDQAEDEVTVTKAPSRPQNEVVCRTVLIRGYEMIVCDELE